MVTFSMTSKRGTDSESGTPRKRRNTAKAPVDDKADVPEDDNGASEVQIKPDPELEDVANKREYAGEARVKEEVMDDY